MQLSTPLRRGVFLCPSQHAVEKPPRVATVIVALNHWPFAVKVDALQSLLAVQGKVAASTQNQALSALLFLYRVLLGIPFSWIEGVARAKRPKRVPTELSQDDARCLLAHMEGRPQLLASLLYGTGMRLMECLRLRVKDVDFAHNEITIRSGKGAKDRHTVLPKSLVEPLQREIERARLLHAADLAAGFGAAALPYALARKYPSAARDFGWQYVFPSVQRSIDPNGWRRASPPL